MFSVYGTILTTAAPPHRTYTIDKNTVRINYSSRRLIPASFHPKVCTWSDTHYDTCLHLNTELGTMTVHSQEWIQN